LMWSAGRGGEDSDVCRAQSLSMELHHTPTWDVGCDNNTHSVPVYPWYTVVAQRSIFERVRNAAVGSARRRRLQGQRGSGYATQGGSYERWLGQRLSCEGKTRVRPWLSGLQHALVLRHVKRPLPQHRDAAARHRDARHQRRGVGRRRTRGTRSVGRVRLEPGRHRAPPPGRACQILPATSSNSL